MKIILIVEDDQNTQDIYYQKLTQEGFKVVQARDGKKALVLAKQDPPDLIILDIMLPGGLNGFDVLEQIKESDKLKDIPVIVLTNLSTEMDVAIKMGVVDYIVKANTPIDTVIEKVKKIISDSSKKQEKQD